MTLAPETELRVASIGRQVYLSGEAVFSVTHDPVRPFRVAATNCTEVQDIGTQFDMRAYPERTVRGTIGFVDSARAAGITRASRSTPIWRGRKVG